MKFFLILSLGISAAFGQYVPRHYIVELRGEPSIPLGAKAVSRAAMASARPAVLEQQKSVRVLLERKGAKVVGSTDTIGNLVFVTIADAQAAKLRTVPGVKSVHRARYVRPALDRALALSQVPDGWNLIGGADKAGVGIKIGIIDTGIDVTHPAFQDASLTVPDGFPLLNKASDKIYTNSKIIVVRSYDNPDSSIPTNGDDIVGHGTLVAFAAAGASTAGFFGPVSGVAPKAWIGSYKVFPDDLDYPPDTVILKALDDAVKDGMNVINLSLGTPVASRPADDDLAVAVERAARAGVVVTVAAGNDGPDPFTISTPAIAPSAVAVGNTLSDKTFIYPVTADGVDHPISAEPGSSVNDGDPPVSGPLADVAKLDGSGEACKALPAASLKGSVALILRGTCTFETKLLNAAAAGAVAGLVYTQAGNTVDPMDTGTSTLPAVMISNADGVDLKNRVAAGTVNVTLNFTLTRVPADPNGLETTSSRGPGNNGQIKPEVSATGTEVYFPIQGGFEVASGTSVSAPLVAGAAAVLEAAHPGLTALQYRSLLINSSNAENSKGDPAKPVAIRDGGTGLMSLLGALNTTVTATPATLEFGVSTGTARSTITLTLANIGTAADTYSITVKPLAGGSAPNPQVNSVALAAGQSQDLSIALDGSGLAPGEYSGYLVVQGTASSQAIRIPYWYAVPLNTPKNLSILYAPDTIARGTSDGIVFRITDAIGVPSAVTPTVTLVSGNLTLTPLANIDADVPGAWEVDFTAGRLRGDCTIHIAAGDVQKDIVVTIQ